jgi:hypothetical protein
MFKWLNKQGVESDKGFSVQFVGRFEVLYKEGEKIISVYVEPGNLGGKLCLNIKSNAFYNWSDGVPISIDKQQEIEKNFKDAMKIMELEVAIY